ncbi:SDR family oxidoreductase [archaeon]|jgi:3-oxoacyl-[acyl-carrier protein] reductase|nr:SDR family oxidoreductase [archaeon]
MKPTAIITGASKGIGKAIAEKLALHGYNLALISRDKEEIKRIAEKLKAQYNTTCLGFKCDIGEKNQVIKTFSKINKKLGNLEVLVNNAGINSRQTLSTKENLTKQEWLKDFEQKFSGWEKELKTNLTGVYICSYVITKYLQEGSIINISSIKGKEATSSPGYGASKAGVIKLTRDFAKAFAPQIRVNCIAPGFIDCGMTTELPEDKKLDYKKLIPLKRFGTTNEIAETTLFLASEKSSYITGATIDVNGGYLMT